MVSAEWEFDQLFYKGTRSKKMHLKHLIFRSLCYFCNSLNFSPHDSIQKLRSAFPNSTLPDTTLYRYLAECKTVKDIDPCIVKHESTPVSMGKPLAVAPNSRDSGVACGSPQKGHISGRTVHYSITSLQSFHISYCSTLLPHQPFNR